MLTQFWFEGLKGRDHCEDLSVDGKIALKLILGKQGLGLWIRFIWLKIEIDDGLL
jgi:hypothetical protein